MRDYRKAAQNLAAALELRPTLHEPGQRDVFRQRLECVIHEANRALVAAENERDVDPRVAATMASVQAMLVHAHAARAEDALHGANQFSMSAQRAPTIEACDEGWQRVETMVNVAKASADAASGLAATLVHNRPHSAVARAARRAEAAAQTARRLVEERNHAYTFHTARSFSFGEGWYLAAAAVLVGVAIQIEPAQPDTAQAERFLYDAGLSTSLQAYRPRPRAMKQTTSLVARAFRLHPSFAQQKLRTAFLGPGPPPCAVTAWIDQKFNGALSGDKVLLWIREGQHHCDRNTTAAELAELVRRVQAAELVPVLVGDALPEGKLPRGALDLTFFWRDPIFQQTDGRRAQLQFFEHLKDQHGVIGQVGVTTAGMDGPALLGLATMYLTDVRNVRMHAWVGAVPEYVEVVRDSHYLECVSRTLSEWVRGATEQRARQGALFPFDRESLFLDRHQLDIK